jgi:hypothetical protein
MRRLLQPLWVLLALLFLAEAWLWENLEPVAARVVAWLPLRSLKAWLAARIENLSPQMTLGVFLVPVAVLFPLKIVAVWMFTHQNWMGGCAILAAGKLVGVGVAAFIFDVTRPKLMQMRWFARVYDLVLRARGWARTMIAPVRVWLVAMRERLVGTGTPRWLRRIRVTRRRMLAAR